MYISYIFLKIKGIPHSRNHGSSSIVNSSFKPHILNLSPTSEMDYETSSFIYLNNGPFNILSMREKRIKHSHLQEEIL